MKVFLSLFLSFTLYGLVIIDKPIVFDQQRLTLTQKYLSEHYGLDLEDITITPRLIVIHWTAEDDLYKSFHLFENSTLACDREDIAKASALNVSVHFLIAKDGKVYRLMPENYMARHTIGLNYNSISIENVGGENNIDNLTPLQLQANIQLIKYLKTKYPSITYMIGHYEYTGCQNSDLWLEKDKNYKTTKYDPGENFMKALRHKFPSFKACSKPKQ